MILWLFCVTPLANVGKKREILFILNLRCVDRLNFLNFLIILVFYFKYVFVLNYVIDKEFHVSDNAGFSI